MKARLLADGATVELFDGDYCDRFPVGKLAAKLAFYRSLRDTPPGKTVITRSSTYGRDHRLAEVYGPTVQALERVEKMVKIMGAGVAAG